MNQGNVYIQTRNKIRFVCRTRTRWLSGAINTTRRRLADLVNSEECTTALVADEVTLDDTAHSPGAGRSIGHANIAAETILFLIPLEDAPRGPDIRIRSARKMERVLIGIGPFEIEGDLYMQPESRPREVLDSISTPFLIVADALVRTTAQPKLSEKCSAILVRRQHVDFIGAAPASSTD